MTGPEPSVASDAADLAKFGYKEVLERRTGRFASFAVAFAFVSIATGIFTTYGAVLNSSGPVGIWTWPIAVIGQLAVAFILGALAARIPVTGYHYQWMSRLANPVLGWILGWISFTFLAIVVVAVDYTIASTIFPVLLNYEGTATIAWIVTALVLLIQAALVAFSTVWAERVNNTFVCLELIGMVALTVLLLIVAAVRGDMDFSNLWSKGAVPEEGYWSFGDWTTAGPWMLGFLLGAFTIVGFESAANLAEETNDPERVVPRAMWQAVLASGVLGFFFILAVTLAAGDPVALAESGTPIADVIDNTLGSAVATLLLLMVVLAIFACGLVIMITGVRLTWAMSRDERFPGWQQWNQVSPRFHTPLKATVLYVVLAQLILATFCAVGNDVVHVVRCRDAASRGHVRLDRGALPGQAQVPAGERQVQPRRLGDPDFDRRRGMAGVRTGAVPRLEFQAGVGLRHRDGGHRRDLSRLSVGQPGQARPVHAGHAFDRRRAGA